MSFQWIIDNAVDIQINKRGIVASTMARDQTVRAVSRGGIVWRFTVTPATGLRYNDPGVRSYIETIDNLDRFTPFTANFSHSGLFAWQAGESSGNYPGSINITPGSSSVAFGGGTITPGDVIQLIDPVTQVRQRTVYSIYDHTTLNRPVLESLGSENGTYLVSCGNNVQFTLICTQLPDYKINPGNIVTWTKPFVFVEALATS